MSNKYLWCTSILSLTIGLYSLCKFYSVVSHVHRIELCLIRLHEQNKQTERELTNTNTEDSSIICDTSVTKQITIDTDNDWLVELCEDKSNLELYLETVKSPKKNTAKLLPTFFRSNLATLTKKLLG
jgi:hypothetical protein